ncbi:hypothetical protein BC937DRAFT_90679 [Endogone sp. FLAS-F59071]|nr:hypothetical protein BC937DRAFT_90679 [Endogone sp. FLAS-F59071]|eukprot:RUS22006.1 hypothetical protein BC937DRAFT_90679 [Endogone sp. FLAS-F59071]
MRLTILPRIKNGPIPFSLGGDANLSNHGLTNNGGTADAKLLVGPDGLDLYGAGISDTGATTFGDPITDALEVVALPDLLQGVDEFIEHNRVMPGGRSDAKPLLAAGDGGEVDTLNVDGMLTQDNVRGVGYDRNIELGETSLEKSGVELLHLALARGGLEVLYGGKGSRDNGRWERGGKNETGSVRADHVDEGGGSGNVTANDAKSLAESTGNNIDLVHNGAVAADRFGGIELEIEMFGHAGPAGAVHTNRMNLVEESDGTVFLGEIADLVDRGDGAGHGVDGLKSNDFRNCGIDSLKEFLKMSHVIVAEDFLLGLGVLNTLNH